ncbi:MAG: hypothetical protein KDD61_16385 [Bdellovibrionales bacterium]|nr:hypothetical protein [Bdellovibrionales bacterium]
MSLRSKGLFIEQESATAVEWISREKTIKKENFKYIFNPGFWFTILLLNPLFTGLPEAFKAI